MSLAWRPFDLKAVERLAMQPHRHAGGGARVLDERLAGDGRVVFWPERHLVAVEGRVAALATGDANNHELAPASWLPELDEQLRARLAERHVHLGGPDPTEVRRADLAGELHFPRGGDGLAFLRALGRMHAPRCKTAEWRGRGGRPETVYWLAERSGTIKLRAYDKGVESGSHAPGERVRVERQWRPPKSKRMTPHTMGAADLQDVFSGPLRSWRKGPQTPTLSLVDELPALLTARLGEAYAIDPTARPLADGTWPEGSFEVLSLRKVERVLGTLAVLRHLGEDVYSDDQRQRRLKELRDLGVGVDDDENEDGDPGLAEVPVVELVGELQARFAA